MDSTIEKLKVALRSGWPVSPGVVIPWNIKLDKTFAFGNPQIKKWKRWSNTNEGLKEVAYFSASWKVEIPSLPSLHSCQLEYHYPPEIASFNAIQCSFLDATKIKNELIENFGATYESCMYMVDKLEVVEPDQNIWTPFSDFPLRISFHPSDWVKFLMDPELNDILLKAQSWK
jgi:hypothetical protein